MPAAARAFSFLCHTTGWCSTSHPSRPKHSRNSFSCQILAEFAVRHPERVDRLVFQGFILDAQAHTRWQQAIRMVRDSPLEPNSLGWLQLQACWTARLQRARKTIKLVLAGCIEERPRIPMCRPWWCAARKTR
jgi:2-hydroxy-6-oxonona-2,4-dienedioate hydrolase